MSRKCLFNIVTRPNPNLSNLSKLEPQVSSRQLNNNHSLSKAKSAAVQDYKYAIAKGMLSFIA